MRKLISGILVLLFTISVFVESVKIGAKESCFYNEKYEKMIIEQIMKDNPNAKDIKIERIVFDKSIQPPIEYQSIMPLLASRYKYQKIADGSDIALKSRIICRLGKGAKYVLKRKESISLNASISGKDVGLFNFGGSVTGTLEVGLELQGVPENKRASRRVHAITIYGRIRRYKVWVNTPQGKKNPWYNTIEEPEYWAHVSWYE